MIKYLIIVIYIVLMIMVGIFSSKKIFTNNDYYIANQKGGFWQITGSLLATILGSSAILGTADLALSLGWAASWFLFSAAIGLFVLIPFSHQIRTKGKYTLPQLIGDFYGNEAKNISSVIISIAWLGVIAAQIIGAAKILEGFTGLPYYLGVWGAGIVFIFYTVIGGQISVLKTDLYQSFLILTGVFLTALVILFSKDVPLTEMSHQKFPFNQAFHPLDLLILLLTYSSTFVVGPDIYSRIFCAQNKKTARSSIFWTAAMLIPFSICITFIGVYSSYKFPELSGYKGSALIPVMNHVLPDWCIGLLTAALLSAVMSSGSTTLLTSGMIINDLLQKGLDKRKSLGTTKIIMCGIGLLSIFISLKITSIIGSLLLALTFFSGAFIIPTLAGLLQYRTSRLKSTLAIVCGGCIALFGKLYAAFADPFTGDLIIITAFLINALVLFSLNPFPLLKSLRSKISTFLFPLE